MLSVLVDQIQDAHSAGAGALVGGSLFDASPFADSLAQSVITGMLYAQDHNYSDELRAPVAQTGTAPIRAAVEFIETHAGEPLTMSEIAQEAGLCVRALQNGFAKHVGATPSAYLRNVRLQRAHEALLVSSASDITVATIASAWGFFNTGRFASMYKTAYGELPSNTLRKHP